jgi:tetrapyrrole methylase family protein/MazG family protein
MDYAKLDSAINTLADLVERLRAPGGCPWDAKQTVHTVRMYLLEEAYEVLDAVERGLPEELCAELGDLLFHIVFIAYLGEEKREFDLVDVVEKIIEKMIRRHPHVFGDLKVENVEEVATNWAKIKETERNGAEREESFLEQVPAALPALQRAHRLSERASRAGFDWADRDAVWKKVLEESGELRDAIKKQDSREVGEEIGDLFFSLVNLARHWGLNAEDLLRIANRKFVRRFELMEKKLSTTGTGLSKAAPDEMDEIWNEIKKDER